MYIQIYIIQYGCCSITIAAVPHAHIAAMPRAATATHCSNRHTRGSAAIVIMQYYCCNMTLAAVSRAHIAAHIAALIAAMPQAAIVQCLGSRLIAS